MLGELHADARGAGRRTRGARRVPLLHDERRMARLQRRQAAPPPPGGRRRGLPARQAQGRGEPRGRHPAPAHRPRGHRVGREPHDRREPGVGRARGDRMDEPPRRVQAALDRRADEPGRHPRARRGAQRRRTDRRRDRRARHEPRAVQAALPGRGHRLLSARLGAARRASTRSSRCTSWPRSSACRCARTPEESASASSCSTSRSSTSCACRARSRTASPSSSTTCTSTSSIRASSRTARTCCRAGRATAPRCSQDSVAAYSFPGGSYWASR